MNDLPLDLKPNLTPGSRVERVGDGIWRLEIPHGPGGRYRLAQLDDYGSKPRRHFPWSPPFNLSLRARASAADIPGTWGFGLWNNPFGMAILKGVEVLRLPALPDTAWFFHASPPNYLSLRDDLPAQGWLAATFRPARRPVRWLALAAPLLPLVFLPDVARRARRLFRRMARQDAAELPVDPAEWHQYGLEWQSERVIFRVDGQVALDTGVAPHGPLGLAIWVDNQYAAWPPDGRLAFGTLGNPEPAWIEIGDLQVEA